VIHTLGQKYRGGVVVLAPVRKFFVRLEISSTGALPLTSDTVALRELVASAKGL